MKKNWKFIAATSVALIFVIAGSVYYYFGPENGGRGGLPVTAGKTPNSKSAYKALSRKQAEKPPAATSASTAPAAASPIEAAAEKYPWHRNITATVFWVGEPAGGGSSENNAISAWDDAWQAHYGGYDDPQNRNGNYPAGFTPKENPFYLDLPYNDYRDDGVRKTNAPAVVYWAKDKTWGQYESMMKNRWVKLTRNGATCYGQIEDAGPYQYDDYLYVFGTGTPKSRLANNAGLDVSPALRDCLKFSGWNNDQNKVDWQFVDAAAVPVGPWQEIITTTQIYWP